MTTQLIQAAQQSTLCLQAVCRYISDVLAGDASSSEKRIARTIMHLLPLEQAAPIQQAEAKTDEPVAWLYIEDGEVMFGHPNGYRPPDARPLVFGDTHPAPGVPDDVVRDAERLNELEALVQSKGTHGLSFDYCKHVEDGYVVEKGFRVMWRHYLGERKPTLREAIDAASLAQKGGE